MDSPIAFLNGSKQDLIDHFKALEFYNFLQIAGKTLTLGLCVIGLHHAGSRLYRRVKNRL